jgi:hypothetical protein
MACVLSYIVDAYIRVQRTRPSGMVAAFSSPRQVFMLLQGTSSQKTIDRTKSVPGWIPTSAVP